jgi:Rrf2 family protein
MHCIAFMENEQVVNTKAIAEKYHIPLELLAKILQKLAKKGLVISHNGPKGGYLLAKDPAGISIDEVIRPLKVPSELLSVIMIPRISALRKLIVISGRRWG